MSSRITEPLSSPDTYNQPGDLVLRHTPEQVSYYRDLATQADQRRQALSGGGQHAPAAPSEPQLPAVHVARQVAGREITRLRGDEARLERDLSRSPIGVTGQPDPYRVQRQKDFRTALEAIRAEISRLDSMDDHATQVFAASLGHQ